MEVTAVLHANTSLTSCPVMMLYHKSILHSATKL